MSELMLLIVIVVVLLVVRALGGFNAIKELTEVATRETSAYNRGHKVKVGLTYQNMTTDLDVETINANIAKIDSLQFD